MRRTTFAEHAGFWSEGSGGLRSPRRGTCAAASQRRNTTPPLTPNSVAVAAASSSGACASVRTRTIACTITDRETSAGVPGEASGVEVLDVLLQLHQEGLEALGEGDVRFLLALELHDHLRGQHATNKRTKSKACVLHLLTATCLSDDDTLSRLCECHHFCF